MGVGCPSGPSTSNPRCNGREAPGEREGGALALDETCLSELGSRGIVCPAPRREPLPKGWFALSRHIYRVTFAPGSPMDYETYLQRSKARYITTIGESIDVYRVD